jgi:flavin-dependent dehydrogenase
VLERDLVIVGGGPAGLSTALHLQALAPRLSITLLEAARYPRDKICAGGVGARAFRVLERLGLELDCPVVPLDALAIRVGDRTLVTREPGLGAVVRRIELDHALARLALARGIDVRDGCPVDAIAVADDHVHVETATGDAYRARAIVGADGVAGIVRRATGFPRGTLRAQVVEVDTPAASVDLPRDTIVFDFTAHDLAGYTWDFPTRVAGEPLVCRGAYALFQRGGIAPRAALERYLGARELPLGKPRVFAEQGFEPGAEVSAPRVLLVGEAAGIDIATGEGIAQAIEYGALAGPFLARAFERDRLAFGAWRHEIERRHLGWQLRIRHACYRAFYSARRTSIEAVLPHIDQLVKAGVQDFAGVPMSKLALARGAAQLAIAFARHRLSAPDVDAR